MFICNLCEYKTNKKSHYERHTKSQKHLLKIKINCNEIHNNDDDDNDDDNDNELDINNIIYCNFCKKQFVKHSNLIRHIKLNCNVLEKIYNKSNNNNDNLDASENLNLEKANTNYLLLQSKNENENLNNQLINKLLELQDTKKNNIVYNINIGSTTLVESNKIDNLHNIINSNNVVNSNVVSANNIKNSNIVNSNNKTMHLLNNKLSNMIDMETFIDNYKNNYQLDYNDTKLLLESYEISGIMTYAKCLSNTLKENCYKQIKDLNIELPKGLLPIIATDSNLRSFKTKSKDKWDATYENNQLNRLVIISNDQVYKHHKSSIFFDNIQKNRIINYLIRDNSITKVKMVLDKYENSKTNLSIKNTNQNTNILDNSDDNSDDD